MINIPQKTNKDRDSLILPQREENKQTKINRNNPLKETVPLPPAAYQVYEHLFHQDEPFAHEAQAYFADEARIPLVVMVHKRLLWQVKRLLDQYSYNFLPCLTQLLELSLALLDETNHTELLLDAEDPGFYDLETKLRLINHSTAYPEIILPTLATLQAETTRLRPTPTQPLPLLPLLAHQARYPFTEFTHLGQLALGHSLLMNNLDVEDTPRLLGQCHTQLVQARQPQVRYLL